MQSPLASLGEDVHELNKHLHIFLCYYRFSDRLRGCTRRASGADSKPKKKSELNRPQGCGCCLLFCLQLHIPSLAIAASSRNPSGAGTRCVYFKRGSTNDKSSRRLSSRKPKSSRQISSLADDKIGDSPIK